jgi:hypothetical protein
MANNNVEWITSERGRSKLIIDNYLFESNGKGKTPGVRPAVDGPGSDGPAVDM